MSPWWFLVGLAILLIGLTKSGFGSGVGLMIVPMTVIAMKNIPGYGPEVALGLMLPLLILGDFVAIYQYRRLFSMNIVRHMLPGTAVGVVVGALLLWWFHQFSDVLGALIRIEIGIESVGLVGLHWWREYRGVQQHLMREPWRAQITGGFAGASSTLAHAAGPIIAMYLLPMRLDRQLFVGTCAIYFFILNVTKLPFYYGVGMFERISAPFALAFAPLVLVGAVFGFWINRRINDRLFSKIIYIVTFALGWYILFDGARVLWLRGR